MAHRSTCRVVPPAGSVTTVLGTQGPRREARPTTGGTILATTTLEHPMSADTQHLDPRTPSRAGSSDRGPVSSFTSLARTVRESGLLERRRGYYFSRTGLLALVSAALVLTVALVGDSWWQLVVAPVVAVVMTQVAFLGHDAAHRQIFTSGRWNDVAARFFSSLVVGLSYGWWLGKHNVHHAAPNQIGRDTDIESKLLAFYPEAATGLRRAHRWMLGHQGLWLFPLLLLEGFNLHFDSLRTLVGRREVKHRGREIAMIVGHWTLWVGALLLVMGPGKAAAFTAVELAVFGVLLGGAFVPNHTGMPVLARGAKVDFLHRQVSASRNVRGSRWVDVVMGGLNRQVEHHLFPSMPRPNLRRVQPLVREFCVQNDIAYTEASFAGAFRDVVTHLNGVGIGARRRNSCPLAAQFRS